MTEMKMELHQLTNGLQCNSANFTTFSHIARKIKSKNTFTTSTVMLMQA